MSDWKRVPDEAAARIRTFPKGGAFIFRDDGTPERFSMAAVSEQLKAIVPQAFLRLAGRMPSGDLPLDTSDGLPLDVRIADNLCWVTMTLRGKAGTELAETVALASPILR